MQLYSYWRSSAAYRVRIVLNLKGINYETLVVNLLQPYDAEPAVNYRCLNPQGLVPALVDNGLVLTQSAAIIEYLEEKFPNLSVLPQSVEARATVRSLAQLIACEIHPVNNLRVLKHLRMEFSASDIRVNAWYRHWVIEGLIALEQRVAACRGDCCFGDTPTMADACLVPQMYNARRYDCDLRGCPNLLEIDEHLMSLPAFIKASPEQQEDAVL